MDIKDKSLIVIIILSSILLTHRWLTITTGGYDIVIIISSALLTGSFAAMILLLNMRLKLLDEKIDEKERSIRININSFEDKLEKKMDSFIKNTNITVKEIIKRIYR